VSGKRREAVVDAASPKNLADVQRVAAVVVCVEKRRQAMKILYSLIWFSEEAAPLVERFLHVCPGG
jgi:hypothetical protein